MFSREPAQMWHGEHCPTAGITSLAGAVGCPCMVVSHATGCEGSPPWAALGARSHLDGSHGYAHLVLNHPVLGCPSSEHPCEAHQLLGVQ